MVWRAAHDMAILSALQQPVDRDDAEEDARLRQHGGERPARVEDAVRAAREGERGQAQRGDVVRRVARARRRDARAVRWDTVAIQALLYRDRVVGALNVYTLPESPPSMIDQGVLGAIANQAAVAVENARFFDETERRVRELDALYRADEHL